MANIELLAEITASGMYIFDYCTKVFFGISVLNPNKIHSSYNILWNDGEFQRISQRKHPQLKQLVYALFTQNLGSEQNV